MKDIIKVNRIDIDKVNIVPIATIKEGNNIVIEMNLIKDSKPFSVAGQSIKLGAILPSGVRQEQSSGFAISGSNLKITVLNSMVSEVGKVEFDLTFTDSEGFMTSGSFFINVTRKTLNRESVESMGYLESVDKLIIDFKSDYEGLRKVIIDENVSVQLNEKISLNKKDINQLISTNLNISFFEGVDKERKLINMITYAINNGYKEVFIPSGVYDFKGKIETPITLIESFNKVNIIGENTKTTIFEYDTELFLKVRGGSGDLAQAYIKNITFNGNPSTTGIQLNNVCGYTIENCRFGSNKNGVVMLNSDEGGFTEFNIIKDSHFTEECSTALRYSKVGSDRSFHGSGMVNCVINQSSVETQPKIIIENGAFPYNSPLDFTAFIRTTAPLIENNGDPLTYFYGNIRTERFGTDYKSAILKGNTTPYNGSVSSLTQLNLGSLLLCDRIQANSDGSRNLLRKPFNTSHTFYGKKSSALLTLDVGECFETFLTISAPFYEQTYKITSVCNEGGHVASEARMVHDFNQAGYGGCYITVEGTDLFLNNDNFPVDVNFTVRATHNQMKWRSNFF